MLHERKAGADWLALLGLLCGEQDEEEKHQQVRKSTFWVLLTEQTQHAPAFSSPYFIYSERACFKRSAFSQLFARMGLFCRVRRNLEVMLFLSLFSRLILFLFFFATLQQENYFPPTNFIFMAPAGRVDSPEASGRENTTTRSVWLARAALV